MFLFLLCTHFVITLMLSFITKRKSSSTREKIIFIFLVIAFCCLVAFRPNGNIPDVDAYRSRYYYGVQDTSLKDILSIKILRKSNVYYMNMIPSLLAYVFSYLHFSFEAYSFIIAALEMFIATKCFTGLLKHWGYEYNIISLLAMLMSFYGYHYLFIATAQGLSMMFVFLSFFLWIRGKKMLAAMAIILAVFSHSTGLAAIVVIIIYSISKQYRKITYICLWFASTVLLVTGIGFFFSRIAESIVSRVTIFASLFYSEYALYNEVLVAGRASFVAIVICILFKFVISADTNRQEYWKLVNIVFFSVLLGAFLISWSVLGRFTDVFLAFLIPLSSMFIYDRSFSLITAEGVKIVIKDGELFTASLLSTIKFLSFFYILITYTGLRG